MPLTPYRAELMQEEMKYHYLRDKHTSVHTHTKPLTHTLKHTHTHIPVHLHIHFSLSSPKNVNSVLLRNIVPTSKAVFVYFHTNHTLLFPMAFVFVCLLRLCAAGACLAVWLCIYVACVRLLCGSDHVSLSFRGCVLCVCREWVGVT